MTTAQAISAITQPSHCQQNQKPYRHPQTNRAYLAWQGLRVILPHKYLTMRILHILDHSIPLHSGYAFRSLALLTEQRRLGWETLQLTTPKQGQIQADEEIVDGWTFYRTRQTAGMSGIPGYFRQMAATQARIEELARKFQPDILHPHSPVLNAIPAIRAGRKLGLPVVYEMRASWEDAAVDHGTTVEGSLRYRLSRALETWALRRASAITTICEGLRADILSRGNIDAAKITVIPNAVDVDSFAYAPLPIPNFARSWGSMAAPF